MTDMNKVVQRVIYLKIEGDKLNKIRVKAFQEYKDHLGKEQELTRKLNEALTELKEFKGKNG